MMTTVKPSFEIMIVFDNRCVKPGFLTGFGFSALIYNHFTENYVLFDTGSNNKILIHNINKFNVDISNIKKVVISHEHFDHAGGLDGLLQINPNLDVFIPMDSEISFKRAFPGVSFNGVAQLTEIEKNIFSSGQIGGSYMKEHALFLRTKDNEIIIIVGCAHPGVEQFIVKAKKMADIKAIIGGFHGFRKFSFLDGIEFIGACHCTQYLDSIKERFPNQFKRICVGDKFLF